jgi:hypothetical protein
VGKFSIRDDGSIAQHAIPNLNAQLKGWIFYFVKKYRIENPNCVGSDEF